MSRSLVKRGLACTTTATPPTTTKSTPAPASAGINLVGRNSGQFATCSLACLGQPAALVVHALERLHSLRGGQLEVLADQALVHGRPVALGRQHEPTTGRVECTVERLHGGVGRDALESSDDRLGDAQSSGEFGLRQTSRGAGVSEEDGGCHVLIIAELYSL